MGPRQQFINILLPSIQVEFFYALIAAVLLFLIYIQTKEFYHLTQHKGIYYFRNAFLFLGIAHVFRFVSNFFMISMDLAPGPEMRTSRLIVMSGYFLFTFVSSVGILSLVYSTIHKKIEQGFFSKHYSLYILAILLFLPVFLFHEPELFLVFQFGLLVFAYIMSLLSYKQTRIKKRKHSMHIMYGLFLVSWIVGMFATSIRPEFLGLKIISYLLALTCIAIILYRVHKKTRKY